MIKRKHSCVKYAFCILPCCAVGRLTHDLLHMTSLTPLSWNSTPSIILPTKQTSEGVCTGGQCVCGSGVGCCVFHSTTLRLWGAPFMHYAEKVAVFVTKTFCPTFGWFIDYSVNLSVSELISYSLGVNGWHLNSFTNYYWICGTGVVCHSHVVVRLRNVSHWRELYLSALCGCTCSLKW